jgi:hypothetical protein
MTWQGRVLAELEKVEPDLAEIGLSETDCPSYVEKAIIQLSKALAPSVKLQRTDAFSARQLGGMVGHKFGYAKPYADGLNLSTVFRAGSTEGGKLFAEITSFIREYFPLCGGPCGGASLSHATHRRKRARSSSRDSRRH